MAYRIVIAALYSILFLPGVSLPQPGAATPDLSAVSHGLPFIRNYTPKEYNAYFQNWDVVQGRTGLMYFANNHGVLEFDGVTWRLIQMGNHQTVSCLGVDSTGRIWVAGENDLGYLEPDDAGYLQFVSLRPRLDERYHDFSEIFRILVAEDQVYFGCYNYLFRWNGSKMTVWEAETYFDLPFLHGNRLYTGQRKIGVHVLENDSLKLVPWGSRFAGFMMYAVLPHPDDEMLIATASNGLFLSDGERLRPFPTGADRWLQRLYHGIRASSGDYIFSTRGKGVVIVEPSGMLGQVIDKSSGLQSEIVYASFADRDGTLWLALENGISHVELPSSLSIFDDRSGLEGTVVDIIRHDGTLYVATTLGAFFRTNAGFKKVSGFSSQSWDLLSTHGQLLVATNLGTFRIEGSHAVPASRYAPWMYARSKTDSNRVYLALANGLASLHYENGSWKDEGKLFGIEEEIKKVLSPDDGSLWLELPNNGLIKITFSDDPKAAPGIRRYGLADGLPDLNNNHLFEISGEIAIGSEKGIFRFDTTNETFVRDSSFFSRTYDEKIFSMAEDKKGRVYVCSGPRTRAETACWTPEPNGGYRRAAFPFLRFRDFKDNVIYPDRNGMVWFGGSDGLILYDPAIQQGTTSGLTTLIRRVTIAGDSVLFGGEFSQSVRLPRSVDFEFNAVRFEYALPAFVRSADHQYQYFLDGFDASWSTWTSDTQKDYTNLSEGPYTFRVRGRNVFEQTGLDAHFSFRILPPWYRTWWAYLAYLVVSFTGLWAVLSLLVKRTKRRAIEEQIRIETSRKEAEERVRKRLAEDFHDELGNKITRISLFASILQKDPSVEQLSTYLSKIDENAQTLYNETRDFIWQLDPEKDSLYDLAVYLKRFGDDLYEGTEINFELVGIQTSFESVTVPMECVRHLVRIFKEAMNNALKHSGASAVVLSIELAPPVLIVSLSDDGKGFDVNARRSGNGMSNMAARAERLRGTVEIDSEAGAGTTITLKVPLPERAVARNK